MKRNMLALYNLFPRYYDNMNMWIKEFKHIKQMGFTAIYINPIHYPGFSGSLYAPKDYYSINPLFIDTNDNKEPMEQLRNIITEAHQHDLLVIMDLVINHSAKDNPLTTEHKDWYLKDKTNKIVSPGAWENGTWISWGDLAQFDHSQSPDKKALWDYLENIVSFYSQLGIDGYRADAAYQIPIELWTYIIKTTKKHNPQTLFLAESLGSCLEDSKKLTQAGFDYLFNSGKWWDLKEYWFIEQYNSLTPMKSIAFSESHDTFRIAQETNSDTNLLTQHLVFTGLISAAWMIITGTEYAWLNKTNVLHTSPKDKEPVNIDLTKLITKINQLRIQYPITNCEGEITIKDHDNKDNVVVLERFWHPSSEKLWFIINTTTQTQSFHIPNVSEFFGISHIPKEILSSQNRLLTYSNQIIPLAPKECKVFYYG